MTLNQTQAVPDNNTTPAVLPSADNTAKSYRTLFIRVSETNNTKNGVIKYTDADIYDMCTKIHYNDRIQIVWIKHEADDEITQTHWHIVAHLDPRAPLPFVFVKTVFPYGDIQSCGKGKGKGSVKACIQYLVHANDPTKRQYSWDDIVNPWNWDLEPYKIKSNAQMDYDLTKLEARIASGEIREYNLTDQIDVHTYAKNKTRILNAIDYHRRKVMNDPNRKIDVVFLSGPTGSGKTTFAKKSTEALNKSYVVSSSSNDPLQDYKGQDVLILDDLRDNVFTLPDLLKVLDNFTNSSIKSRYNNKLFIGDTIYITSIIPINNWYFNDKIEDKHQLWRRVPQWYQFDGSSSTVYVNKYNDKLGKYERLGSFTNLYTFSNEQKQDFTANLLKSLGIDFCTDNAQQLHIDMAVITPNLSDFKPAQNTPFDNTKPKPLKPQNIPDSCRDTSGT